MECLQCKQYISYNARSKVFKGYCRHCAGSIVKENIKKYWGEEVN